MESFRDNAGGRLSILGWVEGPAAEAADVRGVENFLLDLVEEESFAGALMDRCVDVGIAFAVAQIEAGADTIGVGDAICSQMSRKMYETCVLPRQKRLFEGIQKAGGRVRLHICGDIRHLLPAIAQTRPDLIDCDWMVPLSEAREALGPKVVLTGNLDPVSGVMESTPEKIRAALTDLARQANGPYMIGAGCEIPPGTPPENLKALCTPVL